MTLAADRATVGRGTDVLLSGGMRDTSGAGIGGRSVVLYYRPAGTSRWQLYDVLPTGRGGLYSFDVLPPATGDLQVRFGGGPGVLGSVSPVVHVVVRAP
jgi:hypothetical protein